MIKGVSMEGNIETVSQSSVNEWHFQTGRMSKVNNNSHRWSNKRRLLITVSVILAAVVLIGSLVYNMFPGSQQKGEIATFIY